MHMQESKEAHDQMFQLAMVAAGQKRSFSDIQSATSPSRAGDSNDANVAPRRRLVVQRASGASSSSNNNNIIAPASFPHSTAAGGDDDSNNINCFGKRRKQGD